MGPEHVRLNCGSTGASFFRRRIRPSAMYEIIYVSVLYVIVCITICTYTHVYKMWILAKICVTQIQKFALP